MIDQQPVVCRHCQGTGLMPVDRWNDRDAVSEELSDSVEDLSMGMHPREVQRISRLADRLEDLVGQPDEDDDAWTVADDRARQSLA
jgi:hypothetical protein